MSLYPSLEDMKVDQMAQAQQQAYQQVASQVQHAAIAEGPASDAPPPYHPDAAAMGVYPALYPSLDNYMGLELSPAVVQQNMPVVAQSMQLATPSSMSGQMQVAPISQGSTGIKRAEIKQGVREVILCKDGNGKMGLRVRSVNKGVFVAFVYRDSPAAMVGLRFGDQVLQINGETVAGWDTDKTMNYLKKCKAEKIVIALRDRPFERTITLQKDSVGQVGFVFKDGKITSLVKDSSAARNGVLTDHQLVEVNGQNVVGVKDKDIGKIIDQGERTVTITIIPTFIYDHIVKSIGSSLIKKYMDHSIPDV